MAPRIQGQLEDFEVGLKTDYPRVQAVRALDPGLSRAYMADNTLEEIQDMQKIFKRPELQDSLIETYQLLPSGGSIRVLTKFGTAIPLAGLGIGLGQAAHAAQQGDIPGAVAHTAGAFVGELPFGVGDAINETVSGTGLTDGTLQSNQNKVNQSLYKEPKNVYAPTGDKKFDSVAQPFIKMLNGVTPAPKKPKFKQTAIPALNY